MRRFALRRSALYVPGANERALEKARSLAADALILDLEDSVAPEAKERAREFAAAALSRGFPEGVEVAVRVNGLESAWHAADLTAVASLHPQAIVIPKVACAGDILSAEQHLQAAQVPAETALWALLETPLAIVHALEIAVATPRLTLLIVGTNDLAGELHAETVPGRQPLLYALSACVLAARCAGKPILDGVFNDVANEPGFRAECEQAQQLGFDGKTLIHPHQIATCNAVFSPSEAQIEYARRVIEAFEEAHRQGRGVATVDGRLIENLNVEQARRLLQRAEDSSYRID